MASAPQAASKSSANGGQALPAARAQSHIENSASSKDKASSDNGDDHSRGANLDDTLDRLASREQAILEFAAQDKLESQESRTREEREPTKDSSLTSEAQQQEAAEQEAMASSNVLSDAATVVADGSDNGLDVGRAVEKYQNQDLTERLFEELIKGEDENGVAAKNAEMMLQFVKDVQEAAIRASEADIKVLTPEEMNAMQEMSGALGKAIESLKPPEAISQEDMISNFLKDGAEKAVQELDKIRQSGGTQGPAHEKDAGEQEL